jgi:hypothetical protein
MKFALACLIANVSAVELMTTEDYKFMSFVSQEGRSYGTVAEYNFRAAIFKKRIAEHEAHNSNVESTSTMGVNFLTDRTEDEIKKLLGFKASTEARKEGVFNNTVADSIDWRT